MLEIVRDGKTYEQVLNIGHKILGKDLVQNGVDRMVKQVTIEANFKIGGQKIVILFYSKIVH